jgi:hypothetical protein
MHAVEEDSFKVAFVIFIMATLLIPSSKHDYSNIEFWHALGKPSDIGTYSLRLKISVARKPCSPHRHGFRTTLNLEQRVYDCSSYVIHRLLIASAKLKSDINKNMHTPLLSGCTFSLQARDMHLISCSSFPFRFMGEFKKMN